MDLTHQQTRRIFLAGKVAFPTPFASTGTLSFELGTLSYAKGAPRHPTKVVIVQQPSCGDKSILSAIQQRRVAAMFIPGYWTCDKFRIFRKQYIADWENGEWFLGKDISAKKVVRRLKLSKDDDITSRESILRGMVFVGENQPVVNITEVITTARPAIDVERLYCTCCGECGFLSEFGCAPDCTYCSCSCCYY